MPQKNIIQYTVILLGVVVIIVIGVVALISKNQNTNNANDIKVITNTTNINNTNTQQIVLSKKRAGITNAVVYETKTNGERCAVIDLNDYLPTRHEATKQYEWIIEFPDDDCVIQKPPTNLPELTGPAESENIEGTNFRRTLINYE